MQESEKTIEVNNFTFQRHSAPKNIAYYRCSDKRCKARLYYNLATKEISFKNDHLDPKLHKKPKKPCVISVDQPCESQGVVRRCISTHSFVTWPSAEESPQGAVVQVPEPRALPEVPPFSSVNPGFRTVVRVFMESLEVARNLSSCAILIYHAVRANCMENAIVFSVKPDDDTLGRHAALVDMEFESTHADAFLSYLRNAFPSGIKVRVYKH